MRKSSFLLVQFIDMDLLVSFSKKYFLIFVIFSFPAIVNAHQDSYYTNKYDNVTVRIKTSGDCEEVVKSKFIGQYSSYLAKSMGYKGKIFIDLIHDYGNSMKPASFISFDNGSYESIWQGAARTIKSKEKKERIVIRQFQYSFELTKVLKELEYAILNLSLLKSDIRVKKHKGYLDDMFYFVHSISIEKIKKIHRMRESKLIQKVKNKRIRRPEEKGNSDLSYFAQNGKYYLFYKQRGNIEVIDSITNVYSFKRWDSFVSFVFISPKEFICVQDKLFENDRKISNRHVIDTVKEDYYQYITVSKLDEGVFTINHILFGIANIALYYLEDEVLIPDFRKELTELKNKN